MNGTYTVILASRVDRQLLEHVAFISRVSIPAARRFRDEFSRILNDLEQNPFQFPLETDPNLPENRYRRVLFARWYKALFVTEGSTVYLDAVVDCRRSTDSWEL